MPVATEVEDTEDMEDVVVAIMGDLAMVGAIRGESAMAILPFTGDMAMAGAVILTHGTMVTIPTPMVLVCVGVPNIGRMYLLVAQGSGFLAGGFHVIKIR